MGQPGYLSRYCMCMCRALFRVYEGATAIPNKHQVFPLLGAFSFICDAQELWRSISGWLHMKAQSLMFLVTRPGPPVWLLDYISLDTRSCERIVIRVYTLRGPRLKHQPIADASRHTFTLGSEQNTSDSWCSVKHLTPYNSIHEKTNKHIGALMSGYKYAWSYTCGDV